MANFKLPVGLQDLELERDVRSQLLLADRTQLQHTTRESLMDLKYLGLLKPRCARELIGIFLKDLILLPAMLSKGNYFFCPLPLYPRQPCLTSNAVFSKLRGNVVRT